MSITNVAIAGASFALWRHQTRYWPFVRGIHRWPVISPHKGLWRGALTFSLICAWTCGLTNHRDASDLRRHYAHYNVTVMESTIYHKLRHINAFILILYFICICDRRGTLLKGIRRILYYKYVIPHMRLLSQKLLIKLSFETVAWKGVNRTQGLYSISGRT